MIFKWHWRSAYERYFIRELAELHRCTFRGHRNTAYRIAMDCAKGGKKNRHSYLDR